MEILLYFLHIWSSLNFKEPFQLDNVIPHFRDGKLRSEKLSGLFLATMLLSHFNIKSKKKKKKMCPLSSNLIIPTKRFTH